MKRALAVASVACFIAFGAPRAGAAETVVTCNFQVDTSIKLANDLRCSNVDGLVVQEDGVTIDLNGHTIQGTLTVGDNGVENGAGHSGVKVKNGTISGFDIGVNFVGGTRGSLTRLDIINSSSNGIIIEDMPRSRVTNNRILNIDGDAVLAYSDDSVYAGNFISGSYQALELSSNDRSVVSNNVLVYNVLGMFIDGQDLVVRGNRLARNNDGGIELGGSGHRLIRNRISVSGDAVGESGINLTGDDTRLIKNRITGSFADGVTLTAASERNVLRRNVIRFNGDDGVSDLGTDNSGSKNIVTDNADNDCPDNICP